MHCIENIQFIITDPNDPYHANNKKQTIIAGKSKHIKT